MVQDGSAVRVKYEETEEGPALSVYMIEDGIESCRVGFLKKPLVRKRAAYDGKLLQVVRLYGHSLNVQDRGRSHRYCGMAVTVILT